MPKPPARTSRKAAPRSRPAKARRPATPARAPAPKPAPAANPPPRTGPIPLYVLSDSTGNLAGHMLTAFLTQFPPTAFEVRARPFLAERAKLEAALDEAAAQRGVVFHALVDPAAKALVAERCRTAGLHACDLTGEFVSFLSRISGLTPTADPRRLHHVDQAYHRRVEAIEFAMQHDDGLGLDTLKEAEIVLVGVSRTSKTPTTIYLSQMGYKAGNYAMAHPIEPPREVLELPRTKAVGLYIDADQLVEIRTTRQREWHMGQTRYADPDHVRQEIAWSRRIFARLGWPTINVTGRAIEETAARIVDLLGLSRPGAA